MGQFQREGVVAGTPEEIARQAGLPLRCIEEALAELVGEERVRPFQDSQGNPAYQWGDSMGP